MKLDNLKIISVLQCFPDFSEHLSKLAIKGSYYAITACSKVLEQVIKLKGLDVEKRDSEILRQQFLLAFEQPSRKTFNFDQARKPLKIVKPSNKGFAAPKTLLETLSKVQSLLDDTSKSTKDLPLNQNCCEETDTFSSQDECNDFLNDMLGEVSDLDLANQELKVSKEENLDEGNSI